MNNRHQIVTELKEISPFLADILPVNPYTVPAGYFTALPAMLVEKISLESALEGGSINRYQIPQGYFEALAGNILSKIQISKIPEKEVSQELAEIAPFLNTISKQPVYTVPANYFNQTDFIAATRNEKSESKLITLKFARKWMQYAAAAVMAGILVTGAFLFTDTNKVVYEKYDQVDVPSALNKVSVAELETYLDNPEHSVVINGVPAISSGNQALTEVKNTIQRVSDEELDQYLKENGDPTEITAPAKSN